MARFHSDVFYEQTLLTDFFHAEKEGLNCSALPHSPFSFRRLLLADTANRLFSMQRRKV